MDLEGKKTSFSRKIFISSCLFLTFSYCTMFASEEQQQELYFQKSDDKIFSASYL